MIDPEFLQLLVCPLARTPLREATAAEVALANAGIAAGSLRTRGGQSVVDPLSAALATDDGAWLYPIREDIPILLAAEAIPSVPAAADGASS